MSGGHYNYLYHQLNNLADNIESDFINNGIYTSEDYSYDNKSLNNQIPLKIFDRLEDASTQQKVIILKEIRTLINDLRNCSNRAKELEWYMSGDTGADTYLQRLYKLKS
jgi:hypothetical protein